MSIYRIVSFFELIQMLRSSKLRVSSAARFSDANEMIGYLFATLSNPQWAPYTLEGLERAKDELRAVRESHYVSCWTRLKNSIAMWEIYSLDQCSVQLETDEEVISALFHSHMKSAPWTAAHGTNPNWERTVFYPPEAGDCRYENLPELAAKLRGKARASSAEASKALGEDGLEAFQRIWIEASDDKEHNHLTLFFLKDAAYSHEQELRFCLRAMRRNERPYAECKKDPMFGLFDTHLRGSTMHESGNNIFIDFPTSTIKRVWLDGRCPTWIAELQKEMLAEFGVLAIQSDAYGSLSERHPYDLWWKRD